MVVLRPLRRRKEIEEVGASGNMGQETRMERGEGPAVGTGFCDFRLFLEHLCPFEVPSVPRPKLTGVFK